MYIVYIEGNEKLLFNIILHVVLYAQIVIGLSHIHICLNIHIEASSISYINLNSISNCTYIGKKIFVSHHTL